MGYQRICCVHCLLPLSKKARTKDHAPPRSWYPSNACRNRITAPACAACNARLGELEQSLGIRFGLCLDPEDPRVGEIAKTARRAIAPELGTNDTDQRARAYLGAQIDVVTAVAGHVGRFVGPNFEPRSADARSVPVAPPELASVTDKMVRVLTRHMFGEYIEATHQIRTRVAVPDVGLSRLRALLGPPLKGLEHAQDTWSVVWERDGFRMWVFRFWGRLNLVAAAGPTAGFDRFEWDFMEVSPGIIETRLPPPPRCV